MKLKHIAILIFFSLFGKSGISQAKLKGDVMVSVGLARCDLYNKLLFLDLGSKNGPLYPKTQTATNFLDFNITYFSKKNIGKFKPLLGMGFTPYGFTENGETLNDSQKTINYSLIVKLEYASFYSGLSYTIVDKNRVNIKFCQTLNPMFLINKSLSIFNKMGISSRSNILVEMKFNNGNILSVSPFFQTSILKFNNLKKISGSPNFHPYSYGFNLGAYLRH